MAQAITRRSLLAGTASLGVAVAAAGCTTTAETPPAPQAPVEAADLPNYVKATGAEPDLVTEQPNGVDAFFHYPADPQPVVDEAPLNGESITALTFSYQPVAPVLADNPMWQEINAALGGPVELTWAQAAEYNQKFATSIAGGDLPDLVGILGDVPELPSLLESKFTDLTEFLAGDAIEDYPALAAIPTDSWKRSVIGGKIWGVPISRVPISNIPFLRVDMAEAAGVSPEPQSFDELKELMTALTSERDSQWATGDPAQLLGFLAGTLGVPSGWSEQGGKFTFAIEAPEYEQALTDVQELGKAGLFHPDSLAVPNTQLNDWFVNGTCPLRFAGYTGWPRFAQQSVDQGFTLAPIPIFGHDGGIDPVHPRGDVSMSMTGIPSTDPDRVRMLLAVLNWLASPFGSSENLLRVYGIEGETFDFEGTDPVRNEAGEAQKNVPFGYLAAAPPTIYTPGLEDATQGRFDYQEAALPLMAPDPTLGLYSATESSKSSELNATLEDLRNQIIQGRAEVSEWKDAVSNWRSSGGDQIREEYELAFAEAQ